MPALLASGLGESRDLYAYDFDGHGESDWSGRQQLSMLDYVSDLEGVLASLGLTRVVLVAHSMNGVSVARRAGFCFTRRHARTNVVSTG